jgi:hypothetical protein
VRLIFLITTIVTAVALLSFSQTEDPGSNLIGSFTGKIERVRAQT